MKGARLAAAFALTGWALIGWVTVAGPASAQGLDFGAGEEPVTIDATDGIEWQRDRSAYVARGNATATRGDTSVRADQLIAYYTPESDGTDIFRIDAVGGVVILGPNQRVVGDRAVYDVAKGIVVVTGGALSLSTPTEVLTARDSLEYWAADRMAVARGDAVACTGTERLSADILTAYFREGGEATPAAGAGQSPAAAPAGATEPGRADAALDSQQLDRVEAFGGVEIVTSTDRARADQGVYHAQDQIAYLTDNVRISQGGTVLEGTAAQYDLATRVFKVESARMIYVQEDAPAEGVAPCVVPFFEPIPGR